MHTLKSRQTQDALQCMEPFVNHRQKSGRFHCALKGTCQVELLSVGVTVIPGQAGPEMPSSAVGLRCPITASSDAQPACLQKVADVHVCPRLCRAPVCVSQAVSEEEERRRGQRLSVRLSA